MMLGFSSWETGLSWAIVVFLTWCVYHVTNYLFLSPLRKIPSPKTSNFVVGNAFDIFQDFPSFFLRWARRLKSGVLCVRLFMGRRVVVMCDKDSIKHVLVDNIDNYMTPCPVLSAFFKIKTGNELSKNHRKMFQTTNEELKISYISVTRKVMEVLLARWQKQASSSNNLVEVESDIFKAVFDVNFEATLGLKTKFLSKSECNVLINDVKKHGHGLSWRSFLPRKLKQVFNSTQHNRSQNTSFSYDTLVVKTIADRMSQQTEKDKGKINFLSHLLMLNQENNGSRMSEEQICQDIKSLLATTVQTTSSTITRCLQILARHRRIQERVAKEVTSHLPPPGEPITEECLENMTYLDGIVNEVLRLYSPLPIVLKEVIKDDVINGYKIPRGTVVACILSALHRNSEYWDNPDEFNPDRFLDGNIDEQTFIPFGKEGIMSVGFNMAEVKLTLALILRHFRVRPHEGQVYETVFNGSLTHTPLFKCRLLPMDDYY